MQTKKETIVFDVDGVLINWVSQLPFFCVRMGINPKKALRVFTHGKHLPAHELFGIHNEKLARELLDKYNLEHGKYMTAFPDAVDNLYKIAEKYNLVALTKFGSTAEHYAVRNFNIETFFPKCFSELITIDYAENKSEYFDYINKTHGNVIAFVDDQIEYLDDVERNTKDIRCIQLNRYDPNADVNSFEELIKIL